MSEIKIAPSLLSADFADLGGAIKTVEDAGARMLHLDVMDGHFVPNITFGPLIVEAIRRLSRSDLDVHLMIDDPETYMERFVDSGATYLTFHVEAVARARQLLDKAKSLEVKTGLAINPSTPLEPAEPVFEIADLIVMMTVSPGFGGQGFIQDVLPKIRRLYELRQSRGYSFEIEVDGGVGVETAAMAAWAGGDILVAGAAVFKAEDPAGALKAIASAARAGAARRDDPEAFLQGPG